MSKKVMINATFTQKGFSLVELLIASAIGLFLMGAIMQVFSQSKSTVSINQSVNEIQDRGRTLLHHLSFHIKQRGHQGCLPPLALDVNDVDNIDWDNTATLNPLATQLADTPYSRTSLRGYEVDDSGSFNPAPTEADMIAVQSGEAGVTPRPMSDVIHIQYGGRSSTPLSSSMTDMSSAIEIAGNELGIEAGDLIMIGDCTSADIIEVTGITTDAGTTTIEHSNGSNRSSSLSKAYETNAQVRPFFSYTYFVADTERRTRSGVAVYSLYRTDHELNLVELADGVDFLQLSYKHQSSLGVQDITADHDSFDSLKVIGVDVGLLIVGLKDVLNNDDSKIYRLPGAAIGPGNEASYDANKLLKAPFRSYIDLKNRA